MAVKKGEEQNNVTGSHFQEQARIILPRPILTTSKKKHAAKHGQSSTERS